MSGYGHVWYRRRPRLDYIVVEGCCRAVNLMRHGTNAMFEARDLMRIMRWLGMPVGVVVVAIGAVFIAARFHDGPLGIIAGGPLVKGELVTGPEPDWTFAHDIPTVEFQLLSPARSRTTWILELDGRIYIPCGYMTECGRPSVETLADRGRTRRARDSAHRRQALFASTGARFRDGPP